MSFSTSIVVLTSTNLIPHIHEEYVRESILRQRYAAQR